MARDWPAQLETAARLWPLAAEVRQEDTFFPCAHGRLKLRVITEGDRQSAVLIAYARSDQAEPKASEYHLAEVRDPDATRATARFSPAPAPSAPGLAPAPANAPAPEVPTVMQIGVQLIIWGERNRTDRAGVLAEVAQAGFDAVEMGPQPDPDQAAEELRRNGLRVVASHASTGSLERDLDNHLRWLERHGARLLACSGSDYPTSAQYKEVARRLDRAGARCREHGVTLCYHNHAHEITHDMFGLSHILAETDPDNVKLNLDTYWIAKGGQDPATVIRLLKGRVGYLHLKDMLADGSFGEVGQGKLDWAGIRAAAEAVGVTVGVVEQDRTSRTPLESSAMSRRFLKEHWA